MNATSPDQPTHMAVTSDQHVNALIATNPDKNFIDLLRAQAAQRPQQAAFHFLDGAAEISASISFAQLLQGCEQWADAIAALCPAQGRVVLALPSSLEFIQSFLACLCSGRVAVPSSPPLSRKPRHLERLRLLLLDAEPQLIITTAAAQEMLQELVEELGLAIRVITPESLTSAPVADIPGSAWASTSLAFLQYTSGSTAAPKGVMVGHQQLVANCTGMARAHQASPSDVAVSWLPLYHDMGLIGAVLSCLATGIRCYLLAPERFVQAPSLWLEAIHRYRASISFGPNFAFALCAKSIGAEQKKHWDLSAWRCVVNGAEPIDPQVLDEFATAFAEQGFSPLAFCPAFGQAEATLCLSATPPRQAARYLWLEREALAQGRVQLAAHAGDSSSQCLVACGEVLTDHELIAVDPERCTPCAPGQVGELWARGPSVCLGYWRNDEATAQGFAAQLQGDSRRWLRSGDLGFIHEDQVYLCGRLKDLIIQGGRNLYPQDVEKLLEQLSDWLRAGRLAAFAEYSPALAREELVVVAECSRRQIADEDLAQLFAQAQELISETLDARLDRLVLVARGSIVLTTSGKISRSACRQAWRKGEMKLLGDSAELAPQPATADSPIALSDSPEQRQQQCLALLRQELLQLRGGALPAQFHNDATATAMTAPWAQASLWQWGLNSLALNQLHQRLQGALGRALPLALLFSAESLAELATQLAELSTEPADALPSHQWDGADSDSAPLSFAQQRLLFVHELDAAANAHNLVLRLDFSKPLDAQRLAQAWQQLGQRQQILATVYPQGATGRYQRYVAESLAPLQVHEHSALDRTAQELQVQAQMQAERAHHFDLVHGPIAHLHLFQHGAAGASLVLGIHHIAMDGASADVLAEELARLYRGETLPPVRWHYRDFARHERARFAGNEPAAGATKPQVLSAAQLSFWRDYLAPALAPSQGALDLSVLSWGDLAAAGQWEFVLEHSLCQRLQHCAGELNLSLFMLLQASYGLLLAALACPSTRAEQHFLIGSDVAGRHDPRSAGLVGFFVNQLALRVSWPGATPLNLAQALQAQGRRNRAALQQQDTPFDALVAALALPATRRGQPIFQLKFNYQQEAASDFALGESQLLGRQIDQTPGAYALVLDLVHASDGIHAQLEYARGVLGREGAQQLAQVWLSVLRQLPEQLALPLDAWADHYRQPYQHLRQQQQQLHSDRDRARLGQTRRRQQVVSS